jgi:NTP pyrophosphatase (non-canonical NTP hydrolase)
MAKSDQDTTLGEVQNWVADFCTERRWDPYHGPKDLAIGLVTEASELLEIFRFVPEGELNALMERTEKREDIADELADSLYFILRFAQLYGFDLSQALARKLRKNALKYPKPTSDS